MPCSQSQILLLSDSRNGSPKGGSLVKGVCFSFFFLNLDLKNAHVSRKSRKRAIADATGMSTLKAILPSSSIDQQLREDAAGIFFDMHKAIASNHLDHPRVNANIKDNFRYSISERRRKLLGNGYDYDLSWSCEQSEDDLIGNSAFTSSKHMSILGYRVGAAPVGMGDLSQLAQALVRFDTVQVGLLLVAL